MFCEGDCLPTAHILKVRADLIYSTGLFHGVLACPRWRCWHRHLDPLPMGKGCNLQRRGVALGMRLLGFEGKAKLTLVVSRLCKLLPFCSNFHGRPLLVRSENCEM